MDMPPSKMAGVMWQFIKGGVGREPKSIIPTVAFDREIWDAIPDSSYAVAWFGHSSLLIKVGGTTFLCDPVFGERASTFSFMGPKRFNYAGPIDPVLLECGAYNVDRAEIHMRPDETAQAPKDLNAKVLMPIHWAKFDLAIHLWKGSVELLIVLAKSLDLPLLTPRIGHIVMDADISLSELWWGEVDVR